MANQKIILWPDSEAPYTAQSPDQAQPTLAAFEVPGAKIAVVVCPGGGYVCKADHEGDPVAERLNLEGISGFVLDYRVKPCHHMTPLTDAQREELQGELGMLFPKFRDYAGGAGMDGFVP